MKSYKHILEAVNKGIQLALDDYQDIEPNDSISHTNDIIDSEDVIKQKIEIDKVTIDLGLPSGNRWCKYNLGVNPKFLNTAKNYYGNYYAWGEISSRKRKYSWDNYKYAEAWHNTITKYTTNHDYLDSYYNAPDNLTVLQPEDDIATITYGKHFHIPTRKDFTELHENTYVQYEQNYLDKGIPGIIRISKINGNSIFFTLPRYKTDENQEDRLREVNTLGRYWTSELYPYENTNAYIYSITKNGVITAGQRRYGYSIRPLYSPKY